MSDDNVTTKRCSKCGGIFPLTEEFFALWPRRNSFKSFCRDCDRKNQRHYYDQNKEHLNELSNHSYRKRSLKRKVFAEIFILQGRECVLVNKRCPNCKRILPITLQSWSADKQQKNGLSGWCKECRAEIAKEWASNNKDKIRQNQKNYILRHPDRVVAARNTYKENNLEKHRSDQRRWYENNIEQTRESTRRYHKNHPEKRRLSVKRHRARKMNAIGSHTLNEIEILYNSQNGRCFHCGVELSGIFTEDHWIPLTHPMTSDNIENIRLMCRKCNSSKGNKLPWIWRPELYEKPSDFQE